MLTLGRQQSLVAERLRHERLELLCDPDSRVLNHPCLDKRDNHLHNAILGGVGWEKILEQPAEVNTGYPKGKDAVHE